MRNLTNRDLKRSIRDKYAWPGGYELFGVTSDSALLCINCIKSNFRSVVWSRMHNIDNGWKIIAIDASCNLEPKWFIEENQEEYSLDYCAHCNKILNP